MNKPALIVIALLSLAGCLPEAPVARDDDGGGDGTCRWLDAWGEGQTCQTFFGWTRNSDGCFAVNGCRCVGADCGRLYPDEQSCEADRARCSRPPADAGPADEVYCRAQDARSDGRDCGRQFAYWNGSACILTPYCECVGTDCPQVFSLVEDCIRHYGICTNGQ
jgi:hypothetical protein